MAQSHSTDAHDANVYFVPHHTFTVPPVIHDGDLAHGDFVHKDYE